MSVKIRYKDRKDERKPLTKSKGARDSKVMDNKIIGDYLIQKDVAPWFRGTSMYHMQGANMLLNALRDDAEQRTTHRIRSCLNLIGLEPMITSKQITCLMRLSRGNDLSFLWFLLEMHYKTPKPGPYSVNEQLICSAICHLDSTTTIRELDKILPNPHLSKREMAHAAAKRNKLNAKLEEANRKKTKPKYVLPYFEKIRRPEPYGKPLTLVIPSFKVKFDKYNDPNHIVYNELNRWYGNYDFNAGRRIAFSLIRETIKSLFDNFKSASLNAHTIDALCDYHKTIKEMELKLERELKVKARDTCLKNCLASTEEKEKRQQHVKEMLDKAIEEHLCQFRREANTLRKEMTLKTITSDCDIYDVLLGDELTDCCNAPPQDMDSEANEPTYEKENKNISNLRNKLRESNKEEIAKATGDGSKNYGINDMEPKCEIRNGWGDSLNKKSSNGEPTKNVPLNSERKSETTIYMAQFVEKYNDILDETPTPSQTFFQRPKKNQPYKFDYRKIFNATPKMNESRQIKLAFLEALDKDISTLTELQDVELNFEEAVSECAKSTFDQAVKNYELEHKEERKAQDLEKERPLNKYPKTGFYDCNDFKLMDQMLCDAMAHLRKNPKFVLAQLPNSHKLPMLREWISQRFGKEYTPLERYKEYRSSCKIFRALDKFNYDFTMPGIDQMGQKQTVNYNCRKYVDKKCKLIKDEYYRRLDSAFMEQTRIFWFATRAYVCSNGPPRKIFYAYMPSRFQDIQHFRLWKSCEYRNFVGAWNERQREKRSQQFFG